MRKTVYFLFFKRGSLLATILPYKENRDGSAYHRSDLSNLRGPYDLPDVWELHGEGTPANNYL